MQTSGKPSLILIRAAWLSLGGFQIFPATGKRSPELRCVRGAQRHPPLPFYRADFCPSLLPAAADEETCWPNRFLTFSHRRQEIPPSLDSGRRISSFIIL